MAKFTLTIDCGNAAFDDAPAIEVARILARLAEELTDSQLGAMQALYDFNGNRVGEWRMTRTARGRDHD